MLYRMPFTLSRLEKQAWLLVLVAGVWFITSKPDAFLSAAKATYTQLSKKWQAYINSAAEDPSWNKWDCAIQTIVNDYNKHLKDTKNFRPLDWQLIKALVWVESGAGSKEWNSRPMQIGVANDPGLGALLKGSEGGELIVPTHYQSTLTTSSAKVDPLHNLRAGVGYLLMRMAHFSHENEASGDRPIEEVTVKKGDNFSLIAKKYDSTVQHLQALNPDIKILQPGQTVKVQAAHIKKTITDWRPLTTALMHARYNGFGDSNYAQKLDYVIPIIKQGTPPRCPSLNT